MKMLTKDDRYEYQNSLDLRQFGFEKVGNYEYRHKEFFSVMLGEWFAVFSSKRYTKAVEYDKVEAYLKEIGFTKNTISQESSKSGEN